MTDSWDHTFETDHAHDCYRAAVEQWGEPAQLAMLGEEAAELSRAVHRYQNGRDELADLAHEVADCRQLMEQLAVVLFPDAVLEGECDRALRTVERRVGDGWEDKPPSGEGND